MAGLRGFNWQLCNYVGADYAAKPNFKQFLVLDPNNFPSDGDWAGGIITMEPRDFSDITVSTGFQPSLVMLISYRPRNHNGATDTSFGNRGGGMSFGVAGLNFADDWSDSALYSPGARVMHQGKMYVSLSTHTNSEPPSVDWTDSVVPDVNFTGSTRIQQGYDFPQGITRWREDATFNVASAIYGTYVGIDILTLQATLDGNGFTLSVDENLYDQSDSIFWLAISGGPIQVGVMDAGSTEVLGYPTTPGAAMFLSTKSKAVESDPFQVSNWNHMCGFASLDGQVSQWGGARSSGYGWSTEMWRDDESIILGQSANGSGFAGADVDVLGYVSSFKAGGIDLQWPASDGEPYRIGYILFPDGEAGYLEANFTLRPEVVGTNFQPTRLRPYVILMSTTNYTFAWGDPDPLAFPRLPDTFQQGGGGGLGWHIYPFGGSAWGVHTYGNSVNERGNYANSATLREIGCISNGAGANGTPPTAHQHGIYIPPNPVIVGLNYRYAERHAQVKRIHINESDVYDPP